MSTLDLDKIVNFDWSVITSKNIDVVYTNTMLSESVYPDLDRILFKRNWPGSVTWSQSWVTWTPETRPVKAKTIWTVAINEIAQPQDISKIKNSTVVWSNAWFVFWTNNYNPTHSTTITYRAMLEWFLPAWKLIWKKIKLYNFVIKDEDVSASYWNIVYTFKLINSVWDMTTIWSITVATWTQEAMNGFFEYNWAGVVSNEWDMIVMEIATYYSNSSYWSNYSIFPWYEWWPEIYTHKDGYRPIEISIE